MGGGGGVNIWYFLFKGGVIQCEQVVNVSISMSEQPSFSLISFKFIFNILILIDSHKTYLYTTDSHNHTLKCYL